MSELVITQTHIAGPDSKCVRCRRELPSTLKGFPTMEGERIGAINSSFGETLYRIGRHDSNNLCGEAAK